MKRIQHQWGADYLVTDEPIRLHAVPLTSPQGINIQPGQQLRRIGKKDRSCFEMAGKNYIIYEGLLKLDRITYAIFHCPAHDLAQLSLFDKRVQYRYAFACVFTHGEFQCFLSGPGGPKGMRDIQLDFIS